MISVIRSYNMSNQFYEVDATSTVHLDRSYTLSVGLHLPSNCANFATLVIDLSATSIESGEYVFSVRDTDTNVTNVTEFIAVVEDGVTDVDSAGVYGDSVIFN